VERNPELNMTLLGELEGVPQEILKDLSNTQSVSQES
jgi:hypothetical protein